MSNRRRSQRDMIRDALLSGRVISPIDALDNFGCYRLSSVIYDLRREGLDIITYTNPEQRIYAEYSLAQGA